MQVDPDGLAGVKNPAKARETLAQFASMAARMPQGVPIGPWAWLVRAEVAFANGDTASAIEMAKKGLRMRHTEVHAPDSVHDRLRAALQRYAQ
jgi:hypothetical protein